ncbi:MAG: hypothetical protein IPI35_27130 [Deltaproteobacteria bacterium]|nr:hypothetical protein [Deltaproteobacteria bacterium]
MTPPSRTTPTTPEDVEPERVCDETTDLCASGDCVYDINIPIAELDLNVTYDGGKVPSASSGDDVLVLFTETTTGDTQTYSFDGGEDSVQVPYGTYDIALQLGASDPRPNSLTTVRRGVSVSGDAGLNLDMPVGELKLQVTYDGGNVPSASSGDDVLVLFTETSTRRRSPIVLMAAKTPSRCPLAPMTSPFSSARPTPGPTP